MINENQLATWWNQLDDDERAAVLAAQEDGTLTDPVADSLKRAGALPTQENPRKFPTEVERFLKARH